MDKLSQHLNFRETDQNLWNTFDAGIEVYADTQDVVDDFYDQPKQSQFYYNAEFFEGIQACIKEFVD